MDMRELLCSSTHVCWLIDNAVMALQILQEGKLTCFLGRILAVVGMCVLCELIVRQNHIKSSLKDITLEPSL